MLAHVCQGKFQGFGCSYVHHFPVAQVLAVPCPKNRDPCLHHACLPSFYELQGSVHNSAEPPRNLQKSEQFDPKKRDLRLLPFYFLSDGEWLMPSGNIL